MASSEHTNVISRHRTYNVRAVSLEKKCSTKTDLFRPKPIFSPQPKKDLVLVAFCFGFGRKQIFGFGHLFLVLVDNCFWFWCFTVERKLKVSIGLLGFVVEKISFLKNANVLIKDIYFTTCWCSDRKPSQFPLEHIFSDQP